ncbi:MAG: PDDEXK family nuclease [Desulfuromonadaceae bacterium]
MLTTQEWKLISKHYANPKRFKDPHGKFGKLIPLIEQLEGRTFAERAAMYRNGIASVPRCKCGAMVIFSLADYNWTKSCGQKCYHKNKTHDHKAVVIGDTVYESLTKAMKHYTSGHFYNDLYDCSKPHIRYLNNHEETCITNMGPILSNPDFLVKMKSERKPIHEIASSLGVSREKVNAALLFHGIGRKYEQMPEIARTFLANGELFKTEFELYGSDHLAAKYQCSPSTVLKRAHELGCKMGRNVSLIETHLKEYIEGLGVRVIQSDRSYGFELDLHIPEKNLAIELDGLHWHSEWDTEKTNKERHLKKYLACQELGITLLRFTDVETTSKLETVKSIIRAKLGLSSVLYARKCEVREMASSESVKFMEDNHLGGSAPSKIRYGLYYEGNLVMAMTFGSARFHRGIDWEIIRMASIKGHIVVGGASKLLHHFRKLHRGSLMSYSDNRVGNGDSYSKMGFRFVKETGPGYCYYKKGATFSRHKFQKKNIEKVCEIYNSDLTELENAINNGYGRYWDCGNKVWYLVE